MHGDGMVFGHHLGDLDAYDDWLLTHDVVLLGVAYRLAPSAPTLTPSRTATPDSSGRPPTPRNWIQFWAARQRVARFSGVRECPIRFSHRGHDPRVDPVSGEAVDQEP